MANNATQYGVTVQPATPNAQGYVWRAESVAHVPDARNGGRHNVYVSVLSEAGRSLRGSSAPSIVWGWEGQGADEPSPALALDKPPGEWGTNIAIFSGQRIWCRVEGMSYPSDVVRGMHASHTSEGDGTAPGHHSFEVTFRLVQEAIQSELPGANGGAGAGDGATVARRLRKMAVELGYLAEYLDGRQVAKG